MVDHPDRQPEYREYLAWDVPTRLFHWINALAVIGLIATGLEILTGSLLPLADDGITHRFTGSAGVIGARNPTPVRGNP